MLKYYKGIRPHVYVKNGKGALNWKTWTGWTTNGVVDMSVGDMRELAQMLNAVADKLERESGTLALAPQAGQLSSAESQADQLMRRLEELERKIEKLHG